MNIAAIIENNNAAERDTATIFQHTTAGSDEVKSFKAAVIAKEKEAWMFGERTRTFYQLLEDADLFGHKAGEVVSIVT